MEHFDTYFLFLIAFLSTVIFIPFIVKLASKNGFVEANDERKTHEEKVSSFGGIAIYLATAIAMASVVTPSISNPLLVLAMAFPLLLIGFFDDLVGIGISTRIVMQVLLGILVFEMGYQIIDLNSWFLNMGATVFFVVLFINAYNFIDGINGLAGGLGLLGSLVVGALLMSRGEMGMSSLCLAYAGSLAGFLVFNFRKKAKIFMGDCGSTVMGYFMAVMVMAIWKIDIAVAKTSIWPVLVALTCIPVFDLIKVTVYRIYQRRSPVSPDRSHIHHLLVDGLLSHPAAALILVGWTLGFTLLTLSFPEFVTWANVGVFLVLPYFLIFGVRFAKVYRDTKLRILSKNGEMQMKEMKLEELVG